MSKWWVIGVLAASVLVLFTLREAGAHLPEALKFIPRVAAGAFGFLTLIQVFDGPER